MFSVGQLVELVNQPPNYGRSLDGTLARVEWVPRVWSGVVFVEIYRTHRRTGKPLRLKSYAMSAEQLRPIEQPNATQLSLLEQVEPLREEQRARRAKLKEERLLWEKGVLDMGATEHEGTGQADSRRRAREGISLLRESLVQNPPDGVSVGQLSDFFRRHEESLLATLVNLIEHAHGKSKDGDLAAGIAGHSGSPAWDAAELRAAADAHAARLASPLWASESDSEAAWTAALARPSKLAPIGDVIPIESTPHLIMSISALIEEGYEFKIVVQGKNSPVTLSITPDFDALYVRGEDDGSDFKLDSLDPFDLLAFIPTIFPATSGGSITAWTEGSSWHFSS